jgi:hypothetical protein
VRVYPQSNGLHVNSIVERNSAWQMPVARQKCIRLGLRLNWLRILMQTFLHLTLAVPAGFIGTGEKFFTQLDC